jgi:hypothetical protein
MEAILTTPFPVFAMASWVLATTMLFRSWWQRTKPEWSTMDGPERLLAIVVRLLPTVRTAWGTAMTAELAHLHTPSSRWRFASGCVGFEVRFPDLPPRSRSSSSCLMSRRSRVQSRPAMVLVAHLETAVPPLLVRWAHTN